MDYKITIDQFEGPLDLLLHLIKESDIDICDISIVEITNQYLNYINAMESMNLDIASEYIVMAAELIEMKSLVLLPKPEKIEDDYEEDPRQQLITKLLDYKQYKEMTSVFKNLEEQRQELYTKEPSDLKQYGISFEPKLSDDVTLNDLMDALNKFLENRDKNKPLNTKITSKEYSVSKRSNEIRSIIKLKKKVEFSELFDIISKVVPSSMSDMVLGIVQEVYSKSLGTISISIIFTIWAAGKGLYALMNGLQTVYSTKSKKVTSYIFLRIKAILETLLFIFLIVIGMTLLVFGNQFVKVVQEHFGGLENYNLISSLITGIAFIVVTFVVFLLLYKFMPRHKVQFRSQMYGAVFGAVSLNVVSFVFSKYLSIFKGFSITYGSLTTLMLIMMWIYACFYIVFLGAELNKMVKSLQNR